MIKKSKLGNLAKLKKLWPVETKPVNFIKGEIENVKYFATYSGKNAKIYFFEEDGKMYILMNRTDKVSVYDMPFIGTIRGKGVVQTMISDLGFDFAKKYLKISKTDRKVGPTYQVHELCKPLTGTIDDVKYEFEFIFRKYLTGSLYKAYLRGEDPYGLNLPKGMKEWDEMPKYSQFTPTTKGVTDLPLNSEAVRELFPETVEKLEKMFNDFSKHCEDRGLVIIDTKLELFIDSDGNVVLGDEAFTAESSRYSFKENFDKKLRISADKEILRKYATENNFKTMYDVAVEYDFIEQGEAFAFFVPRRVKVDIVQAYESVYYKLKAT